MLKFRASGS